MALLNRGNQGSVSTGNSRSGNSNSEGSPKLRYWPNKWAFCSPGIGIAKKEKFFDSDYIDAEKENPLTLEEINSIINFQYYRSYRGNNAYFPYDYIDPREYDIVPTPPEELTNKEKIDVSTLNVKEIPKFEFSKWHSYLSIEMHLRNFEWYRNKGKRFYPIYYNLEYKYHTTGKLTGTMGTHLSTATFRELVEKKINGYSFYGLNNDIEAYYYVKSGTPPCPQKPSIFSKAPPCPTLPNIIEFTRDMTTKYVVFKEVVSFEQQEKIPFLSNGEMKKSVFGFIITNVKYGVDLTDTICYLYTEPSRHADQFMKIKPLYQTNDDIRFPSFSRKILHNHNLNYSDEIVNFLIIFENKENKQEGSLASKLKAKTPTPSPEESSIIPEGGNKHHHKKLKKHSRQSKKKK